MTRDLYLELRIIEERGRRLRLARRRRFLESIGLAKAAPCAGPHPGDDIQAAGGETCSS